jgi:carbon starvation protein
MFEAVFLMATLDAGTRVGRFMLQDLLGQLWRPLGRTSWYPSVLLSSALLVAAWGYFLYVGVIDPNGGVNILWPLFGIANQMLAAIALSVATAIILKSARPRYAWITGVPLAWIALVTSTAAWQKVMSPDPHIGLLAGAADLAARLAAGTLAAERAAVAPQLIFNQRLDAALIVVFAAIEWLVILEAGRVWLRRARGLPLRAGSEAPYQARALAGGGLEAQT